LICRTKRQKEQQINNHERREFNVGQLPSEAISEKIKLFRFIQIRLAVGSIQHLLRGGGRLTPLRAFVNVPRNGVLLRKKGKREILFKQFYMEQV
jgi:hypothetical protein